MKKVILPAIITLFSLMAVSAHAQVRVSVRVGSPVRVVRVVRPVIPPPPPPPPPRVIVVRPRAVVVRPVRRVVVVH